jgi:DNA-binding transcriptional regulator YiaG
MPNVAKVLKEEISRISRKEAKAAVAAIRKPSVRARTDIADLKRRLALVEKANKAFQVRLAKIEAVQPAAPTTEATGRGWISGKGIRSLRKRMGLSQPAFAKLVGASAQAVYMWESKLGMLKLRDNMKAAVFAVRGLGAREAKKRLEEMKAKEPKKAKKATKQGKRRGK